MTRTRDDFVKECPAFGLDAEGKPGIDESSKSCQYCAANDGAMHDACKDECDGAGEIAEEPADVVETVEAPEPEAPKAKAGKRLKKEKEPKEKKPPKEKKAKKEPKLVDPNTKPSAPAILAKLLTPGKVWNYKELVVATAAEAKEHLVYCGLAASVVITFGIAASLIIDSGKGKNRTIQHV